MIRYRKSEMHQSKSAKLKGLKHSIFNYLIQLNLAEENLPPLFIIFCQLSYFTILSFGMMPRSYRINVIDTNDQRTILISIIVSLSFMTTLVSLIACMIFNAGKDRIDGLINVNIYMTIAFTYIVYPLMTFIMASEIDLATSQSVRSTSLGLLSAVMLLFLLGGLLVLVRLMTRNTIYCKSILASTFKGTEMACYYSGLISMILSTIKGSPEASLLKYTALVVISNLLTLSALLYLLRTPVFWHRGMNKLYASLYGSLICLKLTMAVAHGGLTQTTFIVLLIICALSIKMIGGILHKSYQIDFFDKNTAVIRKCLGITVMISLFESDTKEISEAERHLKIYYTGIWQRGTRKDKPASPVPQKEIMRSKLADLLSNDAYTSVYALRLKIQLQLTQLLPHLKTMSQTLNRLKVLNGSHFFGEFDTYHHRRMIECKLEAIYKGKIKDDEENDNLSKAYSYLQWHVIRDSGKEDNKLEIDRPFYFSQEFKKLETLIERILKYQSNIYEKMDQDGNNSSFIYYRLNWKTKQSKAACDKAISRLLAKNKINNLVTYFYPNLIFFYSLIQYDMKMADNLSYHYKKKLYKYANLKTADANGKINIDLLNDINSVTMRVNISDDRMGDIIDISMNYYEYLGYDPTGKGAIETNISTLLPKIFQEPHSKALLNLSSTNSLSKHESLIMRDFDGCTREFRGRLKLMPSLAAEITAIVNAQVTSNKNFMTILLDKQNTIIGVDDEFTRILNDADIDIDKNNVNFDVVCSNVCAAINMLRLLESQTVNHASNNDQKIKGKRRQIICVGSEEEGRLLNSLKELKLNNDTEGIKYRLEDSSKLKALTSQSTMNVSISLTKIFGNEMTKLLISKSSFLNIASNEPAPRTTPNLTDINGGADNHSSEGAERSSHAHLGMRNIERYIKEVGVLEDSRVNAKDFEDICVGVLQALDFSLKKQEEADSKKTLLDIDTVMPVIASESLDLIRKVTKEVSLINVDENRISNTGQNLLSEIQPALLMNLKSLVVRGSTAPVDKKKIRNQLTSLKDKNQSEISHRMLPQIFYTMLSDSHHTITSVQSPGMMPLPRTLTTTLKDKVTHINTIESIKHVNRSIHLQNDDRYDTINDSRFLKYNDKMANDRKANDNNDRKVRIQLPSEMDVEKEKKRVKSPRKRTGMVVRVEVEDEEGSRIDDSPKFKRDDSAPSERECAMVVSESKQPFTSVKSSKIVTLGKIKSNLKLQKDENDNQSRPRFSKRNGLLSTTSQKIKVLNLLRTKEQTSTHLKDSTPRETNAKINLLSVDMIGQMMASAMVAYIDSSNETKTRRSSLGAMGPASDL